MIELVFHESAGAGLRAAKGLGHGHLIGGVRITVDAETGETRQEPLQPAPYTGPVLEGSSRDVLPLWPMADVGDISALTTAATRLPLWRRLSELQGEDDGWTAEYAAQFERGLARLQQAAAAGEPVRVWWSGAPGEACGFLWACWLLREKPCRISQVKLPLVAGEHPGRILGSTGELEPEQFPELALLEQPLDDSLRHALAARWEMLMAENAPLRAVVNGGVFSVEADFYDPFLRAAMPNETCRVAEVLGRAIAAGPAGVGDGWYAWRVKHLLEQGEWKMVTQAGRFYQAVIAKNR